MTIRPPSLDSLKSLEQATAQYETSVGQAEEYLLGRGIDLASAARFRLGFVATPVVGHEQFAGRLVIPYLGLRGVVSLRFRCLEGHDCKEAKCPKYLGVPGQDTRLFNTRALHEAGEFIAVAEGEMDAIALCLSGVPAVAVPGATSWKPHYARLFAGFSTVYVCGDGDKAGADFTRKVCSEVLAAKAVSMEQGTDVGDLYRKEGAAGVRDRLDYPGDG